MKKKLLIAALVLATGGLLSLTASNRSVQNHQQTTKTVKHEKVIYTCPMHPKVVSDKPGSCPICGMTLVKKIVPVSAKKTVKH
ncbi:heavy metal-binding domain-containing protein [Microbacter margulisiae]|uniref:Cu(I)/Ag(I) efflux system membrane fusion protein n=1 Tax=Microbacter margulisiae TaxID=1350067 RepID=A0A7W5H179_9PORP|nr:heavy metal-binding domain-containing protein [Microbacter margulisiae]MBB3186081.1 Cu(I)/Ag(I) efflux system membrane fusion protein [Microbacter margulisiae]